MHEQFTLICGLETTSTLDVCFAQTGTAVVEASLYTTQQTLPPFTANSTIINASRRGKRIALGSGATVQEVNNLLRQHTQMSKLFKGMGGMASGGAKAQQRLLSQMQGKQKFGR